MTNETTAERMDNQNSEFDAVQRLAEQYRRISLTPVVDDDYPSVRHDYESAMRELIKSLRRNGRFGLSFNALRAANVARCEKWHPDGIRSWSASDWMTAIVGELGEAAGLIKMRNRERDNLPGNKFSPTDKQIADELADVVTYVDLFAAAHMIDLGKAITEKFNEVSERVGFEDRL
jgi:NTP pyrophosphatase (non-canonical NTP hydrolase)